MNAEDLVEKFCMIIITRRRKKVSSVTMENRCQPKERKFVCRVFSKSHCLILQHVIKLVTDNGIWFCFFMLDFIDCKDLHFLIRYIEICILHHLLF